MTAVNLLVKETDYTTFGISPFLHPLIKDYFTLVEYNPTQTYDPNDYTIMVTYSSIDRDSWYQPLVDSGFKLIIDHLQDSDVERTSIINDGVLTLHNPNWMWYWTSVEYQYYGYNNYIPNRNYERAFLMLLNRPEWHRDLLIEQLKDLLDQALYSYVGRGIRLDSDRWNNRVDNAPRWLSYTNTDWYDSTCFSVVAESFMRSNNWQDNPNSYKTEVSEKIFKPLAFEHPFILFGSVDSLAYLQAQGFETYDNLFDETYDTVDDDRLRHLIAVSSVCEAVDHYSRGELHIDALTLEKLAHNRARFYDRESVVNGFRNEVVADILNFIER
jgi:hypothetical protein